MDAIGVTYNAYNLQNRQQSGAIGVTCNAYALHGDARYSCLTLCCDNRRCIKRPLSFPVAACAPTMRRCWALNSLQGPRVYFESRANKAATMLSRALRCRCLWFCRQIEDVAALGYRPVGDIGVRGVPASAFVTQRLCLRSRRRMAARNLVPPMRDRM